MTPAQSALRSRAKYVVVREHLLALIAQGLKPGAPMPSERELCELFGVSRMTVRQAVDTLVVDGVLKRHQGKGTFVASPKVDLQLRLTSFTEEMRRRGMIPGAVFLIAATAPASPVVAEALELDDGAPVHHLRRLLTADSTPMAIEENWIPARLLPRLLDGPLTFSVYGELTRAGLAPEWGEDMGARPGHHPAHLPRPAGRGLLPLPVPGRPLHAVGARGRPRPAPPAPRIRGAARRAPGRSGAGRVTPARPRPARPGPLDSGPRACTMTAGMDHFRARRRSPLGPARRPHLARPAPAPRQENPMSQARNIVDALGGFDNIVEIEPCITRLRCELEDGSLVDEAALRAAGAHGVVRRGGTVQVVVGPSADTLAEDIEDLR